MKNILLLGGTGYVGNILSTYLNNDFNIKKIGTRTNESFVIGNSFSKHIFDEIDVVFYLSWFFDTTDEEYESKNVQQLKDVIEICKKRNINLYFFSTYYATAKSRSKYNQTKHLCEEAVLKNNFSVVKLGSVVLKESNGGFYGNIINFVKRFKILPVFTPSKKIFYKTDSSHLLSFLSNLDLNNSKTHFVCENQPIFFENIFENLNLNYTKINIPWKVPYLFLLILEKLGFKLKFRSDSFLSIWGNQ